MLRKDCCGEVTRPTALTIANVTQTCREHDKHSVNMPNAQNMKVSGATGIYAETHQSYLHTVALQNEVQA